LHHNSAPQLEQPTDYLWMCFNLISSARFLESHQASGE